MTDYSYSVFLDDQIVGRLWANDTHSHFSLNQEYLDTPDRPVLGQYFEDRLQKKARRVQGMHPWFENILPEKSGALRKAFASALKMDSSDSMALLGALGNDLPGAVRVQADYENPVELHDEVVEEERPGPFDHARFSLGGMQLKFSMSGEPHRLSVGISDNEKKCWILKIGTPHYPMIAENEHSIMAWCRDAGFDVPETHVLPIEELPNLGSLPDVANAFLIRRYDRTEHGRIHQEDFCQVLNSPPDRKYLTTDAQGLVEHSCQILGLGGAIEALRRLSLTVATGNCDAHLKNWSIVYPDKIRAVWSPLYDQVCTIVYPELDEKLPLRMGDARYMKQVTIDHFVRIGKKIGLGEQHCKDCVTNTLAELASSFRRQEHMPPDVAARLVDFWRMVPLLKPFSLA